jgi:hypothetical protein
MFGMPFRRQCATKGRGCDRPSQHSARIQHSRGLAVPWSDCQRSNYRPHTLFKHIWPRGHHRRVSALPRSATAWGHVRGGTVGVCRFVLPSGRYNRASDCACRVLITLIPTWRSYCKCWLHNGHSEFFQESSLSLLSQTGTLSFHTPYNLYSLTILSFHSIQFDTASKHSQMGQQWWRINSRCNNNNIIIII